MLSTAVQAHCAANGDVMGSLGWSAELQKTAPTLGCNPETPPLQPLGGPTQEQAIGPPRSQGKPRWLPPPHSGPYSLHTGPTHTSLLHRLHCAPRTRKAALSEEKGSFMT